MITINYGKAVLKLKSALLNESMAHEMEIAELSDKAFAEEGKVKSQVALLQLLSCRYNYFVSKIVSVENLTDADGNEISMQDVKELKIPPSMLGRLIDAHKEASKLEIEAEETDSKKN